MNVNERIKVWLTPQMLAPDEMLWGRLEELAAMYDKGAANNITVGEIDDIFGWSDRIQAELFRRMMTRKWEEGE